MGFISSLGKDLYSLKAWSKSFSNNVMPANVNKGAGNIAYCPDGCKHIKTWLNCVEKAALGESQSDTSIN